MTQAHLLGAGEVEREDSGVKLLVFGAVHREDDRRDGGAKLFQETPHRPDRDVRPVFPRIAPAGASDETRAKPKRRSYYLSFFFLSLLTVRSLVHCAQTHTHREIERE